MSSSGSVYAIYLTATVGSQPAGTVVDNVMWDGESTLTLSSSQAAISDPLRQYPIGSTYVPKPAF